MVSYNSFSREKLSVQYKAISRRERHFLINYTYTEWKNLKAKISFRTNVYLRNDTCVCEIETCTKRRHARKNINFHLSHIVNYYFHQ